MDSAEESRGTSKAQRGAKARPLVPTRPKFGRLAVSSLGPDGCHSESNALQQITRGKADASCQDRRTHQITFSADSVYKPRPTPNVPHTIDRRDHRRRSMASLVHAQSKTNIAHDSANIIGQVGSET